MNNHWIENNPSGDLYYVIYLKPLKSSDFQKQSLDWYQNWLVDWTTHTQKQNKNKILWKPALEKTFFIFIQHKLVTRA